MISFFSPAPKQPAGSVTVASELTVHVAPDAAVASPPQDALDTPPIQTTPRVSDASMPTIDSGNTIQGLPADAPRTPSPIQPHFIPLPSSPNPTASLAPPSPVHAHGSLTSVTSQYSAHDDQPTQSRSQSALPYSPGADTAAKDPRSFSFPSFAFLRSDAKRSKSRPPPLRIQVTAPSKTSTKKASRALFVLPVGSAALSEKRAKDSAMVVRSVIIGDHNAPPAPTPAKKKPVSKADVARVKTQLLKPKSAAKVITQLRALPAHPDGAATNLPIHAVCLDMTDREIHEQHLLGLQSVTTASLSSVSTALADVHLVDLFMAPNMGFGAPVTAQGLFAGSVPTAETVIEGIEQITPQLMALGYATGKAMLPDHKGITVPVDRISALTYWWGFEICLPPPTIAFLEAVQSPGSTLLDLLTALAVLNEGVREVIPFIRYISQFIQSEWNMVKKADEGKGVVCTATWLLPVALVPRPWDFPEPPPSHPELAVAGQSTPTSPSVKRFSATLTTPKPSTEVPVMVPRTSSAYSTDTRDDEDSRPVISSDPPVLPELVVSSPGSIDGAPPKNVDGEPPHAHDTAQHDGDATLAY